MSPVAGKDRASSLVAPGQLNMASLQQPLPQSQPHSQTQSHSVPARVESPIPPPPDSPFSPPFSPPPPPPSESPQSAASTKSGSAARNKKNAKRAQAIKRKREMQKAGVFLLPPPIADEQTGARRLSQEAAPPSMRTESKRSSAPGVLHVDTSHASRRSTSINSLKSPQSAPSPFLNAFDMNKAQSILALTLSATEAFDEQESIEAIDFEGLPDPLEDPISPGLASPGGSWFSSNKQKNKRGSGTTSIPVRIGPERETQTTIKTTAKTKAKPRRKSNKNPLSPTAAAVRNAAATIDPVCSCSCFCAWVHVLLGLCLCCMVADLLLCDVDSTQRQAGRSAVQDGLSQD